MMMLEKPAQATFPLKLGLKDVELELQAGNDTAVPLPLAALLREQHLAAIAPGPGRTTLSHCFIDIIATGSGVFQP